MSQVSAHDDQIIRWNDWKAEFNKVYSTPQQETVAFEIWKAKDAEITQMNLDRVKYFGPNAPPKPFKHNAMSDGTIVHKTQFMDPDTLAREYPYLNIYTHTPGKPYYPMPSAEERLKLNPIFPSKQDKS
ncbi:hypothetical protein HDU86_007580 [Geranomyces michiganensis]|nr:hypothetical protein HDU86_007580 [Geranomyces michiganensis]